jgi:serine protease
MVASFSGLRRLWLARIEGCAQVKSFMRRISTVKLALSAALFTSGVFGAARLTPVQAQPPAKQPRQERVVGFMVKLRDTARTSESSFDGALRADVSEQLSIDFSRRSGTQMTYKRQMSGDAHVFALAKAIDETQAQQVIATMLASGDVESVEPDMLMWRHAPPNDTYYNDDDLWHLMNPAGSNYGINAEAAWDIQKGSENEYVAVLDGGILKTHPDLANRHIGGYDMVSQPPGIPELSADGNGRDPDASDPGDYATPAEIADPESPWDSSCARSSWHGSHVAGTIGASSDNVEGIAGINWVSKIVPVRVLGKCGSGVTSDIIDGMRWAAGLSVTGLPRNPHPARVLNLSLGGTGGCTSFYQTAVDEIVRNGGVVVVAAGNSGDVTPQPGEPHPGDVANSRPANCRGVISVSATTRAGNRAYYSNFGAITIAAPGGDTQVGEGVLSTVNASNTTPGAHTYKEFQGTSMAAPHVAGVVSLMLSHRNYLTPAQVRQILIDTSTDFPSSSTCLTNATKPCGPGIANAGAALAYVDTLPQLTRSIYLPLARR